MKSSIKAFGSLTGFLCLLLLGGASLSAQTATTGSLLGVVTDAQGGVLPGATISAVHTPTNTTYEAVTGGDGRYNILNLRVGPYTVSATMSGFRKEERYLHASYAQPTFYFSEHIKSHARTKSSG